MYAYLTPSEFLPVRLLFGLCLLGALYLFATRVKFLFQVLRIGVHDPRPRFGIPGKRVMSVPTYVFGPKRVLMFRGGLGHFRLRIIAKIRLPFRGSWPQSSPRF